MQVVNHDSYNILSILQVVVVIMAFSQVWIAYYMLLILASPESSLDLAAVSTSLATLLSGFLVPVGDLNWL